MAKNMFGNSVRDGKLFCGKCRMFCGLVDRTSQPDAPTCSDKTCPAIDELNAPDVFTAAPSNSDKGLTPRQAVKQGTTGG